MSRDRSLYTAAYLGGTACSEPNRLARPIELEIGSEKVYSWNKLRPRGRIDTLSVSSLSGKFANRAAQRLARAQLANANCCAVMQRHSCWTWCPVTALSPFTFIFPDPWWRRKHKKRRVLNDDTMLAIERVLVPGGAFHFWTDVLDYYELICGHVIEALQLSGPHYVPSVPPCTDLDYTTHFERRARRNAQPIYRAVFHKPA